MKPYFLRSIKFPNRKNEHRKFLQGIRSPVIEISFVRKKTLLFYRILKKDPKLDRNEIFLNFPITRFYP